MKTVLVTGGSSGIGTEIVRELCKIGYRVYFTYYTGLERAKMIEEETGAKAFYLNLLDVESINALRESISSIDILINNAGISDIKMFNDVTEFDYDRMLGINLKGQFLLTQKFMTDMVSKKWGRIVNISSMWGITGGSCEVHYSASKAGLIGFTKALAKELGLSGITVNCICPGLIQTPMSDCLSPEEKAGFAETLVIPRVGLPEDVADAVKYFIGERASYVTGQVLAVDGGYTI
ncbi:MAG: SDR family oxidoreductase [Clostridia bacterium]|nr:SDR family oxidoreductase [Clostridia bacterium]MBO7156443.1 SDR family oxidoreductase [Clostridia bacterium]